MTGIFKYSYLLCQGLVVAIIDEILFIQSNCSCQRRLYIDFVHYMKIYKLSLKFLLMYSRYVYLKLIRYFVVVRIYLHKYFMLELSKICVLTCVQ